MTATRKASAKATKSTSTTTAAPEPPARKSLPNAERRNEMTHPDGAAAVAGFSCKACGARKGQACTARSGEATKHVHSARMKALDGAPAPKATRTRKAAAN
jgi:hypothetical protein